MSIRALLEGVETRLRSAAVLNDQPSEAVGKVCGVQPDGSPPGNAGQFYYAVHFLGVNNADMNAQAADWMFSIGVTITARMGYSPRDRRGAQMILSAELLDRAMVIAAVLHQDDTHRVEANKVLPGTAEYVAINGGAATVSGFVEPLRVQSIGRVERARPDWLNTEQKTEAYYVEVRFRDARRVQVLPITG